MSKLVVDSSVAVKWVIAEAGAPEAIAIYQRFELLAPDLLMAECANVLWKKVGRGEISAEEASLTARVLEQAEIELVSARSLLEASVRLAMALAHPAYDCAYIALAVERQCRFATADLRLVEAVNRSRQADLHDIVVSLGAAASMGR